MIVLVAFYVWTIYFYNKLLLEVANGKEKEKKPPINPMALVGKSLFKVSQLRKKEETEQKQTSRMMYLPPFPNSSRIWRIIRNMEKK